MSQAGLPARSMVEERKIIPCLPLLEEVRKDRIHAAGPVHYQVPRVQNLNIFVIIKIYYTRKIFNRPSIFLWLVQ